MMTDGLFEEVKALAPFRAGNNEDATLNSLQTVGYKEIFEHLDGKTDLNRAIDLIKQNTRNFAKRQMTWFRKDEEIKWFDPDNIREITEYVKNKTGKNI
jgi:tRNA dimethylallyltransferase